MMSIQNLLIIDLCTLLIIVGCGARLIGRAHQQAVQKQQALHASYAAPMRAEIQHSMAFDPALHMPGAEAASSAEDIPIIYLGPQTGTEGTEETSIDDLASSLDRLAPLQQDQAPSAGWTDLAAPAAHATAPAAADANVREAVDLYADPIDGVPFAPGEDVVLCECGTGYRPSTRQWLIETADGACVQCHATLPATTHSMPGEAEEFELRMAS